jgi:hypothetical protein
MACTNQLAENIERKPDFVLCWDANLRWHIPTPSLNRFDYECFMFQATFLSLYKENYPMNYTSTYKSTTYRKTSLPRML